MGVGDSLEAATSLAAPIPAGTWHLIGDGIVLAPGDVKYEVVWEHAGVQTVLVSLQNHFEVRPAPDQFRATRFEADGVGIAAAAEAGDRIILRFTASGNTAGRQILIPNGDGIRAEGRIPSLTLPAP